VKDNGRTDYWAPDSSLDAELPGFAYQDADGLWFRICVNDFADIDTLPLDPIWGSSFQVLECLPSQLVVRFYNPELDLYEPVNVDVSLVVNSYIRSAHTVEIPDGAIIP